MKRPILALTLLLLSLKAFPFTERDIRFLTFENGLKMYLIEDTSSALVRMEARVGAGYSAQDEAGAGYFPLYARLKGAEISSESVRIEKTCAPSDAEKSMEELSRILEPLKISDKNLKAEISIEKANDERYAADISGFINSAIESKVFSDSPWRRESGANPQVFARNSLSESRSIIDSIARDLYVPENTTLYVSGNITARAAETFAKRYFSRFSGKMRDGKRAERARDAGRRFVLTDGEFSAEMTQVVVQYTSLSHSECDLAATAMEEPFSEFKRALTEDGTLGIRGAEYVNAAAVHKRGSARLVLQTLLEANGTEAANVAEQVGAFVQKLGKAEISGAAAEYEKRQFEGALATLCDSSTGLMQTLADWADLRVSENPARSLFSRTEEIGGIDAKSLSRKIASESPFVFVLMNSKAYAKCERELSEMGFERLTRKNGAWFNQEAYRSVARPDLSDANDVPEEEVERKADEETFESARRFVERNTAEFRNFKLTNGIPVTLKRTKTNTAALAITIHGGELLFPEIPGLTQVLVDSIAVNIRSQLDALHLRGETLGTYGVGARTDATSSCLTVTFASDELEQTLSAVSLALIFGDIPPALADGISHDERTQWRIKSGTAEFQMLAYAFRTLYPKQKISRLYDDQGEKPRALNYPEITDNYPMLLDSTRYALAIAGNFAADARFTEALDGTFGQLGTNRATALKAEKIAEPPFKSLERRMPLRHLFLTDTGADKAGPMPATLIPTTKFLDPALFILQSPEQTSAEAGTFNALLIELSRRIEEKARKVEPTTRVRAYPAEKDIPFARISVLNAERTGDIDRFFRESVDELKAELSKIVSDETAVERTVDENGEERTSVRLVEFEKNALISRIEGGWILSNLAESGASLGTASLIQRGQLLGKPNLYLEHYAAVDAATAADYFLLLETRFSSLPPVRIYSADSKR